jgi:hypothetical protein
MIALILSSLLAGAPEPQELRRFALVVGENDGGPRRMRLRYATEDALAVAKVLGELGGFRDDDRTVLLDTSRTNLAESFRALGVRISSLQREGIKTQLFFYYSGHSDEDGLLLQTERVTYPELKAWIESVPAEVRVAILDSCSSGALTRQKGGRFLPPFAVDPSATVRGHAFLTSASADEAAQESDRIGASFFTHFFVSGLRGAADATHDRKITLSEAYQYAFDETLASTERTRGGAQHPAYDIQLQGAGDLVITDLRSMASALVLDSTIDGRLYVRDAQGHLVAELRKPAGHAAELALEPGSYHVTLERQGRVLEGSVNLVRGQAGTLPELTPSLVEATVSRGGPDSIPYYAADFTIVPSIDVVTLAFREQRKISTSFAIDLAFGDYAQMLGLDISAGAALADELRGVQIAGLAAWVDGPANGLQISGIVNHAGQGGDALWQIGGIANLLDQDLHGAQIGGILNLSNGSIAGAQIGLVNIGGPTVRGAQIGLINMAGEVHGAQIGLVNVADDVEGVSLALVPWVNRAEFHVAAWTTESMTTEIGVELGSRTVYTLLTAGATDFSAAHPRFSFGAGLGLRFPIGPFYLAFDGRVLDLFETTGFSQVPLLPVQARAMVGFSPFEHLAVFAGASANVAIAFQGAIDDLGFAPSWSIRRGLTVRTWPGVVAGLRF